MKTIIFILFSLLSISAFSQSTLTSNYLYSLRLLNNNESDQIIMGDISLLNDEEPLKIMSIAKLTKSELRLLRNAIYAKYGYIFNSKDLSNYFKQFTWYKPTSTEIDNNMSKVDKLNIESIKEFEKMNKTTNNIKWDIRKVGVWQDSHLIASGWSDRFVISEDNKLEFLYSQMGELQQVNGLIGTYTIKGNVLEFEINKISFVQHNLEVSYSGAFGFEWNESSTNSLTFDKPIVLDFPVSEIETSKNSENESQVLTIKIGGKDFYLMATDTNKKY